MRTQSWQTNTDFSDRGSVLLMALLVTFVLLGAGLSAMWVSSSGTKIAGNLTARQEALYAAETGISRGRAVLNRTADWQYLLNAPCGATQNDPPEKGQILCDNGVPLENLLVVASGSTTAASVPSRDRLRYTVYVRNDPFEWDHCDGVNDGESVSDTGECEAPPTGLSGAETNAWRNTNDRDRRVILRAEGTAKDGVTYVALEVGVTLGQSSTSIGGYSQANVDGPGSNAIRGHIP